MVYYGVYLFMWFFVYNLVRIDLGLEPDFSFFGWFVLPNIVLGVLSFLVAHWVNKNPKAVANMAQQTKRQNKQKRNRKYDGYIHGVRKVTWFTKRRFK